MPASLSEEVARLSDAQREEFFASLTEDEQDALIYDWSFWARPDQMPPSGDWFVWALIGGRGVGKTRTGAETVRMWVEAARDNRQPIRIALIGETKADARDVIVDGESGLLEVSPPDFRPVYQTSKRRLTWPDGSMALLFSGDEPDQLRGPQFHKAWVDELAKFRYADDVWSNLELGLRLGDRPQAIVTTTPRPIKLIKQLIADPRTVVTTESTYANISNLAPDFIQRVIQRYEGTRLGLQELHARILDDVPGALWNRNMLEATRVRGMPALTRVVVAVDPAATSHAESNETGIICAGLGSDGEGYIFHDLSDTFSPHEWATRAIRAYRDYAADRIVAETNQGGDMVENTLRTVDQNVSYKGVHASRGKHVRAEPVAALYEQGRIHHVGYFAKLEDQLTGITDKGYTGSDSPDRADALVWAITELMLDGGEDYDPDKWLTFRGK